MRSLSPACSQLKFRVEYISGYLVGDRSFFLPTAEDTEDPEGEKAIA
ncbi:hypothetical protein H6F96_04790 [Microcoleus sp. FACHB-53]|nr:hypothetical protein [Microcoleus sp. FACHB-53]